MQFNGHTLLFLHNQGAFVYDGCGSKKHSGAAALDYISRRAAAIGDCGNSTDYWPGTQP